MFMVRFVNSLRGVCQETLFQLTLSQKLCSERCTRMIHRNPVSASLVLFVPDSSLSPVQLYKMLCRHDLFNCELVPSLGSRELRKPQAPVHSRFTQSWVLGAVNARATAPSTEGGARAPSMQARVPTAKSFFIVHHTQQLAAAAKVGDATGVRATRRGSGRRSPR